MTHLDRSTPAAQRGLPASIAAIATAARRDLDEALPLADETVSWATADRRAAYAELVHAAASVGLLNGFLDAATEHLTTRSRRWPGTGYDRAADDPHVIARFGKFAAALHAAEALVDEAVEAAEADEPDADRRAAVARNHAIGVGRAFISSTIELLGASAASERYGFDRRWRDFLAHLRIHPPGTSPAEIGQTLARDAVRNPPAASPLRPRS